MPEKKLRDLLPEFYRQYDLGDDGGQSNPFVRIEFTKKFSLYIPNFKARKKAVLKHDIHHIVTGYKSTFKGETEIGAWEIGSGCKNYWIAWMLDMSGMMSGFLFNLPGVLKAFARGRRTKNLYYHIISDEEALDMTVDEIREILLLNKYSENTKPGFFDIIIFLGNAFLGLIYSILSILFLPVILGYTLYVILKGLNRRHSLNIEH